ncbi:MAG: ribose-phosphate diphosphokinase [Rickettsiaceae bacterium H1]|nr:ribose-phosphate diphosphokinase [Rickettsiaceae bacterium H1]
MLFSCDNVNEIENEIIELTKAVKVGHSVRFADGESFVEITGKVDGDIAIVLQSVVGDKELMSLLIMIDALKRHGFKHIVGVVTYFGYARQDKKIGDCLPIGAKLVANLLESSGLGRLITVDLHNESICGFFNIPVINVLPTELFANDIFNNYSFLDNVVIVSPDVGAIKRAREMANCLGKNDVVVIDKHRFKPGISQVMNVIGNVKGRCCIITDDIVDSAGTLCNTAKILKEQGAKSVDAYITHGVLAGRSSNKNVEDIIIKISESHLDKVTITNSVNYPVDKVGLRYNNLISGKEEVCKKIRVMSISELIAKETNKI